MPDQHRKTSQHKHAHQVGKWVRICISPDTLVTRFIEYFSNPETKKASNIWKDTPEMTSSTVDGIIVEQDGQVYVRFEGQFYIPLAEAHFEGKERQLELDLRTEQREPNAQRLDHDPRGGHSWSENY